MAHGTGNVKIIYVTEAMASSQPAAKDRWFVARLAIRDCYRASTATAVGRKDVRPATRVAATRLQLRCSPVRRARHPTKQRYGEPG